MNINATFIGQTIAFLIFIYICYKYIWPHLIKAIEERQEYISSSLTAAIQAQDEAQKANADNIKTLEEARAQAREIIDSAKERANQIIDKSREEALKLKKEIEEQGHQQIALEKANAEAELRKQVSTLAILGAEKILNKQIDKAENDELINRFLDNLNQEQNG